MGSEVKQQNGEAKPVCVPPLGPHQIEERAFPLPVSHPQRALWRETDIAAWIDSRPRAVVLHPLDLQDAP